MSPGHLLIQLQRRGINLLPTAADAEYVENITPREAELEDAVVMSMARCATALEFQNSPWNQSLPCSQIGLLAKESTVCYCKYVQISIFAISHCLYHLKKMLIELVYLIVIIMRTDIFNFKKNLLSYNRRVVRLRVHTVGARLCIRVLSKCS